MVKGKFKVTLYCFKTTSPNLFPHHVSTSCTLLFPRYRPDKALKVKFPAARSKVKTQSHYDNHQLTFSKQYGPDNILRVGGHYNQVDG